MYELNNGKKIRRKIWIGKSNLSSNASRRLLMTYCQGDTDQNISVVDILADDWEIYEKKWTVKTIIEQCVTKDDYRRMIETFIDKVKESVAKKSTKEHFPKGGSEYVICCSDVNEILDDMSGLQ